jgi:hypothetical protein
VLAPLVCHWLPDSPRPWLQPGRGSGYSVGPTHSQSPEVRCGAGTGTRGCAPAAGRRAPAAGSRARG